MDAQDNGWESPEIYAPVIEYLARWLGEVDADPSWKTVEGIGLRNSIHAGAEFVKIPEIIVPGQYHPEVRVVDDCESDRPEHWEELVFDGGKKRVIVSMSRG